MDWGEGGRGVEWNGGREEDRMDMGGNRMDMGEGWGGGGGLIKDTPMMATQKGISTNRQQITNLFDIRVLASKY